MTVRPSARLALAGVVAAVLSLVFTGVPARPLVVLAAWLLVLAGLHEQPQIRWEIRVFTRTRRAVALLVAVAVIGLAGYWATQPLVRRWAILGHLDAFATEGRQIESDFTARLAAPDRLQGDYTAKVQDWHRRIEAWVGEDLGPFYTSRLATPRDSPAYPAGMPVRLRVFWDTLETDLAAMDQFRSELSGWLF